MFCKPNNVSACQKWPTGHQLNLCFKAFQVEGIAYAKTRGKEGLELCKEQKGGQYLSRAEWAQRRLLCKMKVEKSQIARSSQKCMGRSVNSVCTQQAHTLGPPRVPPAWRKGCFPWCTQRCPKCPRCPWGRCLIPFLRWVFFGSPDPFNYKTPLSQVR